MPDLDIEYHQDFGDYNDYNDGLIADIGLPAFIWIRAIWGLRLEKKPG